MPFRNFTPRLAFLAFLAGATSFLVAQPRVRTTTAGREFRLEGSKGTADIVAGGQRFRAGAFQEIFVRAPIHLSPSGAADTRAQRLIVRFRTSDRGPRLIGAEILSGSQVLYRNEELNVSGDYGDRETTTPRSLANVFDVRGRNVGANAVIRLKLSFGGGFDSVVDNGVFVINGVEAEFPLKPVTGQSTIPMTRQRPGR